MNVLSVAHGWRVTGWFFFVVGGAVSVVADLPESNRAFRTIFNLVMNIVPPRQARVVTEGQTR